MKREFVESRALYAHGYDPESQTLAIQYHSGAIWHYPQVSAQMYGAFLEAESMGEYFAKQIKPFRIGERQPDAVKVFVCGRNVVAEDLSSSWRLVGIFSSEDDATAECRDETYFVAPHYLDVALPDGDSTWDTVVYPLSGGDILATMQPGLV